jgi:hypothetical protein
MSWKRRWTIIGALVSLQIGIVLCYQSFLSGEPAPAVPPEKAQGLHDAPPTQPSAPAAVMPVTLKPNDPAMPAFDPLAEPAQKPVSYEKEGIGVTGSAAPAPASQPPSAPPVMADVNPPPAISLPTIPEMKPEVPPPPPIVLTQAPPPPPCVVAPPLSVDRPPMTTPTAKPLSKCPWKLNLEIVDGMTHVTALNGKVVQFRVVCEKLDLQAPHGCLDASGNVKLTCDGIDGTCDRLSITWQDDRVVLEGKAKLKCQRDGQDVELSAARLSLRLHVSKSAGTTGRTSLVPIVNGTESSEPPLSASELLRQRQGTVETGSGRTPSVSATPKSEQLRD